MKARAAGTRETQTATPAASHPSQTADQGSAAPSPATPYVGRSFLDIPIFRDERAAAIAEATAARAVTLDSGIYFGRGMYRPDTTSGRTLIAHELVHAAQQRVGRASGAAAADAAETEAAALAPRIARAGWAGVRVRQPAVPVMRDKIPDADLSQDRDAIRTTLRSRFPWLYMLSNRVEIEDQFVERIVYARKVLAIRGELDKLPDPRATYLSDEIEERTRRRAPVYRRLEQAAVERDKHGLNVKIDLAELFSPQLAQNPTKSAGIAAAVQEIKKHQGWVHLDNNGLDSFRYGMWIQIDGLPIPIEKDGLHLSAFFADPYMNYATIDIQREFYAAHAQQLEELLQTYSDAPGVASENLQRYVADVDEARLPTKSRTPEEQLVDEYRSARLEYAETVRSKTEAAMVPLIIIASFFEIDGPVDLLLAVVPVEKLGAKLVGLGKEALKARKARKLERALIKEFEGHLQGEWKAFVELAERLTAGQRKALKQINKHIESPGLIKTLMQRSIDGTADLKWIAKKLESKNIDANFVRSFTQSKAGPSWQTFMEIVEKKVVDDNTRRGFAGQIKGLLGERAAVKFVQGERFAKKLLGGAKGTKVETLITEVGYGVKGADGTFDLVAVSDKGKLIFGEVKHYKAETWEAEAKNVLAQLDRHNDGIKQTAKALNRRPDDVAQKVLFVSEEGFKGMTDEARARLRQAVMARGWTIEPISDVDIETFNQLIDHVR